MSEQERVGYLRRGTKEIQFDTHGMTDECPIRGNVDIEECSQCHRYRGHQGFTVYCKEGESESNT